MSKRETGRQGGRGRGHAGIATHLSVAALQCVFDLAAVVVPLRPVVPLAVVPGLVGLVLGLGGVALRFLLVAPFAVACIVAAVLLATPFVVPCMHAHREFAGSMLVWWRCIRHYPLVVTPSPYAAWECIVRGRCLSWRNHGRYQADAITGSPPVVGKARHAPWSWLAR